MPTLRLPLAGSFNQRGIDGSSILSLSEDQRFLNCAFDVVTNPVTGSKTVYCEKRPGWIQDSIVSAGNVSTGLIRTDSNNSVVSAFGATNSTIYEGSVSVGTITGTADHFTETLISGIGYVLIRSSDGTGWYYPSDAKAQTSYTGDTHTNTTIDNIASTAGMYPGQEISGTNIVSGTRIASITSATAIVVDTATTGTSAGVTITKTPIAKITDADFVTSGTTISALLDLDGYIFYVTSSGYVYNSDLNSASSYTANNRLAVQMSADAPTAIAKTKNRLVVGGNGSIEVFSNAGNPTGSPLVRNPEGFSRIGVLDQRSISELEDDLFFVSSARYGDVGVYRMKGFQPQAISTPTINRIIGTTSATGGMVYLSAFRLGGYAYIGLYCVSASSSDDLMLLESGEYVLLENNDFISLEGSSTSSASFTRLLVYNVDLGIWGEWDCSLATYIIGVGYGATNQILASSRTATGGKIYTINPAANAEVYTDDGAAFNLEIRTSKLDLGTAKRKFVSEIRLLSDIESTGTASLYYSDDDYATWTLAGTFDLTSQRPKITRLGAYEGGRAYKIVHSANAPFRAYALEIDYEAAA